MRKFLILALLAFPQHGAKREKPLALDPVKQRQVSVAWGVGRMWAEKKAATLFDGASAVQLPHAKRVENGRMRKYAQYNLTVGVANQICEAYGISRKTLNEVAADPRSRRLPFVEEPVQFNGIQIAVDMDLRVGRTKFDPNKVILPEKIAARIGYKNPPPPDPNAPKPTPRPRSVYIGPRPPGFPQAEWDRLHPPVDPADEHEINDRAKQALKNMKDMESLISAPRNPGP